MLIEVPQFIEDGERVCVRSVPSVIRLSLIEHCDVGGWDRPVHSRSVNNPLAHSPTRGEASRSGGLLCAKASDKLVEGGAQAMHRISDDDSPLNFRELHSRVHFEQVLRALRIQLTYAEDAGITVLFGVPLSSRLLRCSIARRLFSPTVTIILRTLASDGFTS
jgi:hypothetical protein